MGAKQWVVRQVDQARQQALAQELAISPITASVLLGRGIMTTDQARGWLSPTGAPQHDPFFLPQMEQAVDRLHRAVTGGERVCVYSDYDVDGVSAASLYVTWFGGLGASIHHYVPHRVREGYGLNIPALERLARQGVTLLVTADCGTTSVREVEAANRLGLDVIVTDHHQVPADLPAALAILNPHRPDSTYPFRGLCSAGLAYKVAQAYAAKFRVDDQALEPLLDLVALATVADVVPLQEENRVFVRHGLALMERGARCGIRALKQGAGVRGPCTAGTVAFRLGPRINAAGRLDHADDAVRLLTTHSEVEARTLAERLEQ
ncbi:MAG: single-stranded-DNA-specific exonuclease RecJ, partial [Nitrospirales bacterium]